jgi:hypothetical protein
LSTAAETDAAGWRPISKPRDAICGRSGSASHDESTGALAENRIYDRELLNSLPANRRVALHGFERRLLLWKRRTGVAIASVLSPLRHYVTSRDTSAPPVGLGELAARASWSAFARPH